MRLSSALLEALKSFNRLEVTARAGTLPGADGMTAAHRILAGNPSAPGNPTPRQQLAGSIGESAEKAKVDPYLFSPPEMTIS